MTARYTSGKLITIDGKRVHVRADGPADGQPLVLIHGFGASLHWFDRLTPLLSATYRVIRVDLAGHGRSGGPAIDAPEQADMVAAVLEQGGVTGAVALGHSFGADVAIELAEHSPRVAALVVVGQAPDYQHATFPPGSAMMTVPVLGSVLHRLAPKRLVRRVAAHALAPGFRLGTTLDRQVLDDHKALDAGMFRVILRDRRQRMAARPLDTQVQELGIPTLVILGERDRFYGARSASRYRAAGAHVTVIERAGHSPTVETPSRTARLIENFICTRAFAAQCGPDGPAPGRRRVGACR